MAENLCVAKLPKKLLQASMSAIEVSIHENNCTYHQSTLRSAEFTVFPGDSYERSYIMCMYCQEFLLLWCARIIEHMTIQMIKVKQARKDWTVQKCRKAFVHSIHFGFLSGMWNIIQFIHLKSHIWNVKFAKYKGVERWLLWEQIWVSDILEWPNIGVRWFLILINLIPSKMVPETEEQNDIWLWKYSNNFFIRRDIL